LPQTTNGHYNRRVATIQESLEGAVDRKAAARPERFCRYVESRLTDLSFAVMDIGAHFRVSNRYVRRMFSAAGETPSQYLLRRRLELAYQMLADPGLNHLTILSICLDCGFAGPEHFCRAFRVRYGMTPTEMRKLHKG
jgi:AraC-like DNA-binding protein